MIDKYRYQDKIVVVLKALRNKYGYFSTLVKVPTGGGKTITAQKYIKDFLNESENNRVLWLVDRLILLGQTKRSFINPKEELKQYAFSEDSILLIPDEKNKNMLDKKIIIASYLSLLNDETFSAWSSSVKECNLLVVIDEAHHSGANGYNILLDKIKKAGLLFSLVGLTATPYRGDNNEKTLFKWFKHGYKEVYDKDLSNEEYFKLSEERFTRVDNNAIGVLGDLDSKENIVDVIDIDGLTEIGIFQRPEFYRIDDFTNQVRELLVKADKVDSKNPIIDSIVKNIKKDGAALGKTLIFVDNVEVANALDKALGSNSRVCIGQNSQSENEEIISDFSKGKFQFLITVRVVAEGADIKGLNTIILANGVRSKIRLIQQIGRVVRADKDIKNKRVIWYDFATDTDKKVPDSEKNFTSTGVSYRGYLFEENTAEAIAKRESDRILDKDRKTYYLTAPSYINPVNYLDGDYRDVTETIEYIELINHLNYFTDNEIDYHSCVGYLKIFDDILYIDKKLEKSLHLLSNRLLTDVLIARDENQSIKSLSDYLTYFGYSESSWLDEVKLDCFYLSSVSDKTKFHISDAQVIAYADYVLQNNMEPFCETLQTRLMAFIEDNKKNIVLPVDFLKELKTSDLSDVIAEIDDDILLAMIEAILNKSKGEGNSHKDEELSQLPPSALLEELLRDTKEKYAKQVVSTDIAEKERFANLVYEGTDYFRIKDLYSKVAQGFNHRPSINRDVLTLLGVPSLPTRVRYIRDFYHTTQVLMQSILRNYHHIKVADKDVIPFKELLEAYCKQSLDEDTYKDILCRIAYDQNQFLMEKENSQDIVVTLLDYVQETSHSVPVFLQYLAYDRVYAKTYNKLEFYKSYNGIPYRTTDCQNLDDILAIGVSLLDKTKKESSDGVSSLPSELSNILTRVVDDAIADYRPYIKMLHYYQGIKPDLFTREINLLASQVPHTKYISGCGGSGADTLNYVGGKRTYNEYGFPLMNMYRTLSSKANLDTMLSYVDAFGDYIVSGVSSPVIQGIIDAFKAEGVIPEHKPSDPQEVGDRFRKKFNDKFEDYFRTYNGTYNSKKKGIEPASKYYKSGDENYKAIHEMENRLYGVHNLFNLIYQACVGMEDEKIVSIVQGVDDWQTKLAFLVFLNFSFPDRPFFDSCFIDSFVRFMSEAKSLLCLGYEQCHTWEIQTDIYPRDVIEVLSKQEPANEVLAYCDIPYVSTDDKTYASSGFNFHNFNKEVMTFGKEGGSYIISSRFNIIVEDIVKAAYYNFYNKGSFQIEETTLTTDSIAKELQDYFSKKGYSTAYFEETDENGKRTGVINEEAVNNYFDRLQRFYADSEEFQSELSKYNRGTEALTTDEKLQISKACGRKVLDSIINIYDFYTELAVDPSEGGAKYIVIPYTNAQETIKTNEDGKVFISKEHNSGRIDEQELERMFKRTMYSRIPVEVMVTNIDLSIIAMGYPITNKVNLVPTVMYSDASSATYSAEPAYLVIDYEWYINTFIKNVADEQRAKEICEKEREDTLKSIDALSQFYKH